jgi:hypothetical protein
MLIISMYLYTNGPHSMPFCCLGMPFIGLVPRVQPTVSGPAAAIG